MHLALAGGCALGSLVGDRAFWTGGAWHFTGTSLAFFALRGVLMLGTRRATPTPKKEDTMHTATLEVKAEDRGPDGRIKKEARARIVNEARERLERLPEAIRDVPGVRAQVEKAIHAALDEVERADLEHAQMRERLDGAEPGMEMLRLGLEVIAAAVSSAFETIEALPEGLTLAARSADALGEQGKLVFDLGKVANQLTFAKATLSMAKDKLEHLVACDCGVGEKKTEESSAPVAEAKAETAAETEVRA
jgi:chromosome segregation ATPase